MKTGYNFDQITNTVTISVPFAKKASQVGTPEYDILLKLRRDYPSLKILKEEKTGKAQLTYRKMEEFIKLHRNSDALLKEFESAKTLSKFHSMPYTFVKTWFLKKFTYYGMEDAYILDEEGKIKMLPLKKENAPVEREAPAQPLEVLKNQDSEDVESGIPSSVDSSTMPKAG